MNGGEEVSGEPVVSGCDASEVFQPAERPLDGVAVLVERWREAGFVFPIDLWRDVRRGARIFDLAADEIAVVALVALNDLDIVGKQGEQRFGCDAIRNVSAGQNESNRPAEFIGQRMDFCRAPAARAPDRLVFLPPLPPDAQRCAFTALESIRTCVGGPPAWLSA